MISFQKRTLKYYYHPDTGEFVGSCFKIEPLNFKQYPYIEREEFSYSDYRVDVDTLELIHEPKTRNPRS